MENLKQLISPSCKHAPTAAGYLDVVSCLQPTAQLRRFDLLFHRFHDQTGCKPTGRSTSKYSASVFPPVINFGLARTNPKNQFAALRFGALRVLGSRAEAAALQAKESVNRNLRLSELTQNISGPSLAA
jgi:hypothetical protein